MKQIFSFFIYVSIAVLTFFILTIAFNKKTVITGVNAAAGELVNYSECTIPGDTSNSFGHSSSEDSIDYKYDGTGTLYLAHINSGFSLCPGELIADISISDNSILIKERESETGCYEMCLYNMDYVIKNFAPGTYTIKVVEPYAAEAEPLEFTVDLSSATSGSFCITRNFYPWGEF